MGMGTWTAGSMNFNPRFPRGKRRIRNCRPCHLAAFQSTLPAGEATEIDELYREVMEISIHASRGGSDGCADANRNYRYDFNPRFPRGKRHFLTERFQLAQDNFNPRFPRGKRPSGLGAVCHIVMISIHASRGGSDLKALTLKRHKHKFQSTLPAGEATY